METPKRDRPEAGRPGQRERSQRALQGTENLKRGGSANMPGPARASGMNRCRRVERTVAEPVVQQIDGSPLVVLCAGRLIRAGMAVASA